MPSRKVFLFESFSVVLHRLGNAGYQTFYRGRMEVYLVPEDGYKLWVKVIGRGENLIFNGIIPKNCAVMLNPKEPKTVTCGKIPSDTYVNEKGLMIPTLWKFCFHDKEDTERLYYLACAASSGFAAAESNIIKNEEAEAASRRAAARKPLACKNINGNKNNSKKAKNKVGEEKVAKIVEPPKAAPRLTLQLPESSDESDGDSDSLATPNWDDDNDSAWDDLESPVFAESQNVATSMHNFNSNNM